MGHNIVPCGVLVGPLVHPASGNGVLAEDTVDVERLFFHASDRRHFGGRDQAAAVASVHNEGKELRKRMGCWGREMGKG